MYRPPTPPRLLALAVALGALAGGAGGGALAQGEPAPDAARGPAPGTAATVDGVVIPEAAVDEVARQLEADGTAVDRARVLDELIDMEVLAQAAERVGLDAEPGIATALRLQRMQTLANAFLADAGGRLEIDEAALREEYERQATALPEREFRASHVLLDDEADARDVIAELDAGADFAALAAERSLDPAGTTGGGLGWVVDGSVDEALLDALEGLAPGEVAAAPVRTDFGFHVLRLDEVRGASTPDFAAVRPGLRELVLRRRLAERVEAMRANADVVVR